MKFTVTGHARRSFRPERADLRLHILISGLNQADVHGQATRLARQVADKIESLTTAKPAPVVSSVIQPVTGSSWRDGESGNRTYQAQSSIRVRFADFDALSAMVDWCGDHEGVIVDGVDWDLTDETRDAARADILTEAVADAKRRASIMADAAGFSEIRFVQLSDPGLASASDESHGVRAYAMRSNFGGELTLVPDDIDIHDSVVAVFEA